SREYDWDGRSHLLCCRDSGPSCEDDIHLETDELGCDFAIALVASLRPAILDSDGSALDPAKFTQPLHEGRGPRIPVQRCARPQKADGRQLRLLRSRRERPGSRAAEQRDELASSHGSLSPRITPYHTVVGKPCCASPQNWLQMAEMVLRTALAARSLETIHFGSEYCR